MTNELNVFRLPKNAAELVEKESYLFKYEGWDESQYTISLCAKANHINNCYYALSPCCIIVDGFVDEYFQECVQVVKLITEENPDVKITPEILKPVFESVMTESTGRDFSNKDLSEWYQFVCDTMP